MKITIVKTENKFPSWMEVGLVSLAENMATQPILAGVLIELGNISNIFDRFYFHSQGTQTEENILVLQDGS